MANSRPVNRRRALTICAGMGAMAMLGPRVGNAGSPYLEWRGHALGGPVRMAIRHRNEIPARRLIANCVAEIERLERIFSLYRPDSEISRLNREGHLENPSHDFRLLLGDARRYGSLSGGAFDVTVQPLWRLYSRHFAARPAEMMGPDPRDVERLKKLVDYRRIDIAHGQIALAQPGMEVTMNGIAQGYITDRIANMLHDAGLDNVLVDMGEISVLQGGTWNVGVADPDDPRKRIARLAINGCAVATSAGSGTRFEPSGRFHHLFDPATGNSSQYCRSATVLAPSAATADALATAIAVSPVEQIETLLRDLGGHRAIMVAPDRSILDISI